MIMRFNKTYIRFPEAWTPLSIEAVMGVARQPSLAKTYYLIAGRMDGKYTYIIAERCHPWLAVFGAYYTLQYSLYNSRAWYRQLGGDAFWDLDGRGTVYTGILGGRTREVYNSTTQEWEGDAWWLSDQYPYPVFSEPVNFVARGKNNEDETKNLSASWYFPRWEKVGTSASYPDFYGEYEGRDGNTSTMIMGVPQFLDDDNKKYVRTVSKISGRYNYGNARYNSTAGKWIIGKYKNEAGWWESATEPDIDSGAVFNFASDDEEATGSDITLTFDKYVKGDESEIIYFGEMRICRI